MFPSTEFIATISPVKTILSPLVTQKQAWAKALVFSNDLGDSQAPDDDDCTKAYLACSPGIRTWYLVSFESFFVIVRL